MWPWRVNMPTQNLLMLLLLLMLVMRIVLATVCCRFGSWGLVMKLNFCSEFQHKVWEKIQIFWVFFANFLNYGGVWKIINYNLQSRRQILTLGGVYEAEVWSVFNFLLMLNWWTQPSGPLCLWQCFILVPQEHFWSSPKNNHFGC